jgi:hypothetical protein
MHTSTSSPGELYGRKETRKGNEKMEVQTRKGQKREREREREGDKVGNIL